MTVLGMIGPVSEESLAIQVSSFIARWLKVEPNSICADADLAADLGLDLFEITELMIVLEQQFCSRRKITEPSWMVSVSDLIHHIEQHQVL